MRRNECAALLLGVAAAMLSAGADWNQFRGPKGDGIADQSSAPQSWSADEHLAWKVEIPGAGWSQPVAFDGRVFVTTAVNERQTKPNLKERGPGVSGLALLTGRASFAPPDEVYQWKLLCLSAADGKLLWEKTVREGRPAMHIHPTNTYASETPATDGECVVAYFGMTGLYCFDRDGRELWKADLGAFATQFGWGSASSPIIHGDCVYVQCDNDQSSFLVALDKRTGEQKWRAERDEHSNWCTPHVWKNRVRTELVVGGGGRMRSYDPDTGELLWELAGSGRCSPSPVGNEDVLIVDSADRLMGRTGRLVAVKPGGQGDLSLQGADTQNEFIAWSVALTSSRLASPLIYHGSLYFLEQGGGIVRCLDVNTGKEFYRQRIPGAASFVASPWASDGKVYCLDENGLTSVLAAGSQFQVLGGNRLEGTFWSSPGRVGEKLLLRSVDHLYCVSP